MHIKNNPIESSQLTVAFFLNTGIIVTAGFILLYGYMNFLTIGHFTLDGFFGWAGIFLLFPAVLYICGIIAIIKRHQLIKKSFSEKNLTSVDFLSDRIKFNFVDSKYNFAVAYNDLDLLLTINTELIASYRGIQSFIISAVNLTFEIKNPELVRIIGKNISIRHSSTLRKMELIYKIIDYEKKFRTFNYYISGYGLRANITEKIETYRKTGYKTILTKADKKILKFVSIMIFVLLMIGNFLIKKDINLETDLAFCTTFLILPISTLFIDIFMLICGNDENDNFFIRNTIICKICILIIYVIY